MDFRRTAVLVSLGALSSCQALLNIEEGKKRDAGAGDAASSASAGGGSAGSASTGGGCGPRCQIGEGCLANADCVSGACVSRACALTPRVLLLATGINGPVLAGRMDESRRWDTDQLEGRSVSAPAITITPEGRGIGLLRFTQLNNGDDNVIQFTTWTAGSWDPLKNIDVTLRTYDDVAISASGEAVEATYLGLNNLLYHMAFDGEAWPQIDLLSNSFCGSPADSTANDGAVAFAYAANNGQLFVQPSPAATATAIGMAPSFSPAIVRLTPGPEMMVAFFQSQDNKVYYTTGSGGDWKPPLEIPDTQPLTFPMDEKHRMIALTALPDGAAAVAYRGADGSTLHVLKYTPAQPVPWSPLAPDAKLNVPIDGTPAIARGIAGDEIELAYVSSNQVFHTSYSKGVWSAPAPVTLPAGAKGVFTTVAIASAP